jgi:hypothetical protein
LSFWYNRPEEEFFFGLSLLKNQERLIVLKRTFFYDKAKITFKGVKYHDSKFNDKDYRFIVSGTVNGILYDNDEILIPVSLDEALPPYTEQKNNIPIEFAGFLRDTAESYKKESI